jgi:hypothetical protein
MIIVAFVGLLLIGIYLYGFNAITTSLTSQNIMVGQSNLTNVTEATLGQINTALIDHGNLLASVFLFAMVIAIILAGFITRGRHPVVFFVIEFIILIFAYILAVYIANAYETTLSLLPFAATFTGTLPTASTFLLNLPLITVIAGALTLIVSYAAIPKTKEEQVAGF